MADFDRIARCYRWAEYASLGRLLQRTRLQFLERLDGCRRALVLGDGDGRFVAALMRRNPAVRVDVVDGSAAMLGLLRKRVGVSDRLTTHHALVPGFLPEGAWDLVVTHFFLDCLTQWEVEELTSKVAASMEAGGLWVVSEFRIPEGGMRVPARLYVGMLYRAFGLLTGLRVRVLPDYARALTRVGFVRVAVRLRMFGVLTSELWMWPGI